ncbi:UDP-N-acetylglucosamine--LPS N-acetylglucosamine transferase [Sandarakinorhabdus sp. DWP1-3-1]|uniref:UDP-N-acetylglucosamine--LPS N-acetylglucosamine transferase n=1 Tax=Sandarakinorhabdus sp. DWP1-3-1 TaxID=2804627 RepID=UPI003CE992F4
MSGRKRVLAIASGGGHFVQLLRLAPAWAEHDVTYATVHAASAIDVAPAPLLTFRDVSRADLRRLPLALWDIAAILIRVRPQVIITTGALPPLLALALVRPFGVRTLWVDSIANSEVLSGSGRHAGKVATAVLTQWPQLAEPKVEHWGSVL